MDERRRHVSVVGPVILIGAGLIFLLNNLGMLPWSVWGTLFLLWPVLLIAIGLDILIGRRSAWGSALLALVLLVLLGGVIWWSMNPGTVTTPATVTTTVTINQPLGSAGKAEVDVGFGTGTLSVDALPESAGLVEGMIDLSRGESAVPTFRTEGDTAFFTLRSQTTGIVPAPGFWDDSKKWDLGLNRDVPMKLHIGTGVGKARLDLSRLDLTELSVQGGVGETELTLPRRGELQAQVNGGLGQITIVIPSGMAARIRLNGVLGDVSVSGDYQKQNDTYTSPDYATSADRVDLQVDGVIGKLVVR
jgi:hypothetical protein